ncbi:MAG: hypothetical protein H3C31_00380 [Brumimicrobium sp.]|nr:hypothetical protein [Brumimicrobium sp.]MCO5268096.1 hypothetical protein [Brumimicrobium sp.]
MEINKTENANDLLIFALKNKKILFIVSGIAVIVSIVVSLLLPVLYMSNAIVFPGATNTVSFNAQSNAKASSMDFGEEERAEQMIQILQSSPMRDRIISDFDLAKVYEIKPNIKGYYHWLNQAYEDHISFRRTKFGSINIEVLDKDPQRAANIANRIVDLIDTLSFDLIRERTIPAYEINRRKLLQLQYENDSIDQQLYDLAKLGVISAESRGELYRALNEAKNSEDRARFKKQIEANEAFGAKYDALTDMREYRMDNYALFKASYEQAKSDAFEGFSSKFVVERAAASDLKAKPKRIIIVLVFTLSSLLLTFIILLISNRIKEIKKAL